MSNKDNIYFLEKQVIVLDDFECDEGWILDFGGGGEGVIDQLKGSKVVAIDRRESELIEALEAGSTALPIVMDGKELKFPNNTFHTATAFYSLMYVPKENIEDIFNEIYRVLIPGGKFFIWDGNFVNPADSGKSILAYELTVKLPSGKIIETGYGTKKTSQSMNEYIALASKIGFKQHFSTSEKIQFHLILEK